MTFREMQIIIDAALLRDARLAWQAAQYHRFAVHAPNDMPEQPGLETKSDTAADAEIAEIRRRVKVEHDTMKAKKHGR